MIGLKHFDVTVSLVNTHFLIGQTFTDKDPLLSDRIPKLSLGRDKIETMECWGRLLGERAIKWRTRARKREERRVLAQDASGCGYFLHCRQLGGFAEYGMTHNVEGAPREGERQHRGGEPPAVPRGVALALSRLTQAS